MLYHKTVQSLKGEFVKWINNDEFIVSVHGEHLIGHKDFWEGDFALPYTHNEDLNSVITELMNDWYRLVDKAKHYGMDIRLHPESETLKLYFHDDYPDTLLVDKELSSKRKGE